MDPGPPPQPLGTNFLPTLGPALVPCSVHLPVSSTRQEITPLPQSPTLSAGRLWLACCASGWICCSAPSLRSQGGDARAGPWGAAPCGPGARPLCFLTVNGVPGPPGSTHLSPRWVLHYSNLFIYCLGESSRKVAWRASSPQPARRQTWKVSVLFPWRHPLFTSSFLARARKILVNPANLLLSARNGPRVGTAQL